MTKKRIVLLLVFLVIFCLGGSILYLIQLPVPLSVKRQINKDLSGRVALGAEDYGWIEQIFSRDSLVYTYEIVEVIEINPTDDVVDFQIYNGVSKLLCISIRVDYPNSGPLLMGGWTNPGFYNYLAEKKNNTWLVMFLDKPNAFCP